MSSPAKAREFFTRATTLAPTDVPAWVGLAFACNALKDVGGKLAALEKALLDVKWKSPGGTGQVVPGSPGRALVRYESP